MAGFALSKSAVYACFFDKALKTSRQMATAVRFSLFRDRFAQQAQKRIAASQ
jgi:hypothetical protein